MQSRHKNRKGENITAEQIQVEVIMVFAWKNFFPSRLELNAI